MRWWFHPGMVWSRFLFRFKPSKWRRSKGSMLKTGVCGWRFRRVLGQLRSLRVSFCVFCSFPFWCFCKSKFRSDFMNPLSIKINEVTRNNDNRVAEQFFGSYRALRRIWVLLCSVWPLCGGLVRTPFWSKSQIRSTPYLYPLFMFTNVEQLIKRHLPEPSSLNLLYDVLSRVPARIPCFFFPTVRFCVACCLKHNNKPFMQVFFAGNLTVSEWNHSLHPKSAMNIKSAMFEKTDMSGYSSFGTKPNSLNLDGEAEVEKLTTPLNGIDPRCTLTMENMEIDFSDWQISAATSSFVISETFTSYSPFCNYFGSRLLFYVIDYAPCVDYWITASYSLVCYYFGSVLLLFIFDSTSCVVSWIKDQEKETKTQLNMLFDHAVYFDGCCSDVVL